jgi:hypothetical protein
MPCTHLCDVEEQERHHEREQAGSFGESESQDGVLEELAPKGRVAGNTLDEATENRSDSDTGAGKTDGSETGTLDLGGSDHGSSRRLDDDAALLDHVAGGVVAEGAAGSHEGVGRGLTGCEMRVNGCETQGMGLNGCVCSRCERATYQRWRSRGRPRGRRRRSGRWQPL